MPESSKQETKTRKPYLVKIYKFYFIALLTLLVGCATTSPVVTSSLPKPPPSGFSLPPMTPVVPTGVYHSVQKGETLWKIAQAYHVPVEEIIKINRLPDPTKVKVGERIFVPTASKILDISKQPSASLSISGENFIWPARGRILAYFNEGGKEKAVNKGIDISLPEGSPVVSARSGKISFVHMRLKGLGKTIIIDHGDGYQTIYGHLSEILVTPGDQVIQGKVIAKSGNSGRTIGPSLHFEIRESHRSKNPLYYLT